MPPSWSTYLSSMESVPLRPIMAKTLSGSRSSVSRMAYRMRLAVSGSTARMDRLEVQVVVGALSGLAVEPPAVGASRGLVVVAFGVHRLRRAS